MLHGTKEQPYMILRKLSVVISLFMLFLISFMNCENVDGHKNPPYRDQPMDIENSSNTGNETEMMYSKNRDILEQPELVIEKMGDIKGKTVADIGAGYGFYAFRLAMKDGIKKVLALDIDPKAIEVLESFKEIVPDAKREQVAARLETRLVEADNPKLKLGEADIILLANIAVYFEDRIKYLKSLNDALADGGKLIIVDYKKRRMQYVPPQDSRIPLWQMEQDLEAAGYTEYVSDDRTLEFQYIISVNKALKSGSKKINKKPFAEIDWMDIDGNREIWQQPNAVIRKMGNLKGKTVADIGAGPYGYFAVRLALNQDLKKVIALDIDKNAIANMEAHKNHMNEATQKRFETRLVAPDDPKLKPGEADVILIANTASFFEDRVQYFSNLKKGLSEDGIILIVDFKKRKTPITSLNYTKVAVDEMEKDLLAAGYKNFVSDDRTLQYQYIITAKK